MSRKSLAIGLSLVVIIGLVIVYLAYNGSLLPNSAYAGYTQIQVYRVGSYIGLFSEKLGDYDYYFVYYPDSIISGLNQTVNGKLQIWRQDVQGSTDFPLTTNISHDYYGMTFIITQVKPDYVIVMAKPTA
jgi:hypothetical protein